MKRPSAIALLVCLACSNPDNTGNAQNDTKDWVEHREPDVFAIRHPAGWTVWFDDRSGRIRLSGPDGETASIWAVYSRASLDEGRATRLLAQLAAQMEPDLSWERPVTLQRYAVGMRGTGKEKNGAASVTWLSNESGSAVFCYAVSAPLANSERHAQDFAAILASFHPVIPSRPASQRLNLTPLQYTRWQDPTETAFTVEIPRGWRVQGGLTRYTAVDYRRGVYLESPDQSVNVFLMDPGIPFFVLPDQTTMALGMGEGTFYTAMDGSRMLIRRYASGVDFAHEYALSRFSNALQGFSIRNRQDRPDIAQVVNREFVQLNAAGEGMMQHSGSAGEVSFSGTRNGQPYQGYVTVTTVLSRMAYGGAWEVRHLSGFVAPEPRVDEAVQVMTKLVSSFTWNPQWFMRQYQTQANVADITARTAEQLGTMIGTSFGRGQERIDRAMRGFTDYLRGTITLRDEDGREFNVWNSSNYYWVDIFDDVGGTELFQNPDVARFRQLVEIR